MQEIKCPNCGKVFQVDESGYAQIMQQVRDKEFTKELERRESELKDRADADIRMALMEQEKKLLAEVSDKDAELKDKISEIEKLKFEQTGEIEKLTTDKDREIEKLKLEKSGELEKLASDKDREIEKLRSELNEEINKLKAEIERSETEKKLAVTEAVQKKDREFAETVQTKDRELAETVQAKDRELAERAMSITELTGKLESKDAENELKERAIKEQYETALKMKDEQIEYYKDFKARQSTKMIGESLEQHCQNQFNSIRMTAFPNAYFEKDNDAKTGSKGDFIFRESAEDGTEFISIMFEMKNEADETATKHKNEDFFKELDKDRREKNCEYAVLVSLLEADNEYYNNGIVDVSYRYDKMYVIRPQFFIPMITLLRNAALNSLKYQRELQVVRNQQLDIMNFEDNMNAFKDAFGRNYRLASEKFMKAIEEIDKTIDHLQKTKAALMSSENNLRLANNKAEELSIKKLTKNAPSVRELFDELKEE